MTSVSREKKARILELKEKWTPHEQTFIKLQSILVWVDNPSRALFVFLCIIVHFALRWGYYFITELSLITLICVIGLVYFFGKWILTYANIPWTTLLPASGPRSPIRFLSLEDAIVLYVNIEFWLLSIKYEMQHMATIDYTKFTLQIVVVLLVFGYIGTFISGFTVIYLTTFLALFLPGVYMNGLLAKLQEVLQPHIAGLSAKLQQAGIPIPDFTAVVSPRASSTGLPADPAMASSAQLQASVKPFGAKSPRGNNPTLQPTSIPLAEPDPISTGPRKRANAKKTD